MSVRNVFTITNLTFREAWRKKFFWVAVGLGVAFLAFFTFGFTTIINELEREFQVSGSRTPLNILISQVSGMLLVAGLFAINFLVVMMTGLLSVGTVSGEVDSHVIQTLVTKPQPRWQIIVGKWLGFSLMLVVYVVFMVGGLILCVFATTGYLPPNILPGMALLILEGVVMLSLAIAGGTVLSTQANGVLVFMLYGIAFVGSWVEQIGSALQSEAAVQFGIVSSLIMPSDALWRMASTLMMPRLTSSIPGNPFALFSQPSNPMVVYAVVYSLSLLGVAVYFFSRRDL